MTKEEMREQLQKQFEHHLKANPDAVTLYAAERVPERRPWKKRPNLRYKDYAHCVSEILSILSHDPLQRYRP